MRIASIILIGIIVSFIAVYTLCYMAANTFVTVIIRIFNPKFKEPFKSHVRSYFSGIKDFIQHPIHSIKM